MWFPADGMERSFVWIPIVAAPVFLQAEEPKRVDEQAGWWAKESPPKVKFTTDADHGGVLSFWGVGPHDLIVATNGQPIHNALASQDVLDGAVEENKPVLLDVIAKGNRRTINLLPLRDRARLKKGAPRFWQFRGC